MDGVDGGAPASSSSSSFSSSSSSSSSATPSPCRFFLTARGCRKGIECEYSHGGINTSGKSTTTGTSGKEKWAEQLARQLATQAGGGASATSVELNFWACELTDSALERLSQRLGTVGGGRGREVTTLRLGANAFSSVGLRALSESFLSRPSGRALSRLNLCKNVHVDSLEPLVLAGEMGSLTALICSFCSLRELPLQLLRNAPRLQELAVDGNRHAEPLLLRLAAGSSPLPPDCVVSLEGTRVQVQKKRQVVELPRALCRSKAEGVTARRIWQFVQATDREEAKLLERVEDWLSSVDVDGNGLGVLSLAQKGIDDRGLSALANALFGADNSDNDARNNGNGNHRRGIQIKTLRLYGNDFGPAGLRTLAQKLKGNQTLHGLGLSACASLTDISALAEAGPLNGLQHLGAGENALAQFPLELCAKLPRLQALYLNDNRGTLTFPLNSLPNLPPECRIFLAGTKAEVLWKAHFFLPMETVPLPEEFCRGRLLERKTSGSRVSAIMAYVGASKAEDRVMLREAETWRAKIDAVESIARVDLTRQNIDSSVKMEPLATALAQNSNLKILLLSMNAFGSEGLSALGNALKANAILQVLHLAQCDLHNLDGLARAGVLSSLRELDASGNALATFPDELCSKLPGLQKLIIHSNKGTLKFTAKLSELPGECRVLLESTYIEIVGIDFQLVSIPKIFCRGDGVSQGGKTPTFGTCVSHLLTYAHSAGETRSFLARVEEWREQVCGEELALSATLYDNHMTELAEALKGNISIRELRLTGNYFEEKGLSALARALVGNTTLEVLALSNNYYPLKSLSPLVGAGVLTGLRELHAGVNAFPYFPRELCENFPNLQGLWLNSNKGTLTFPKEIDRLPLTCRLVLLKSRVEVARLRDDADLKASGIESMVTLPKEYCGGTSVGEILLAVRAADLSGTSSDWKKPPRLRLMVIGDENAGKTTLTETLRQARGYFGTAQRKWWGEDNRAVTFGVDVTDWSPNSDILAKAQSLCESAEQSDFDSVDDPVQLSVWDFAGQLEYHPYHLMFLAKDALYLLVFNAGRAAAQGPSGIDLAISMLESWVDLLSLRARGARVLIVGTHSDAPILQADSAGRSAGEVMLRNILAEKCRAWSAHLELYNDGELFLVDALNQDAACDDLAAAVVRAGTEIVAERSPLPPALIKLKKYIDRQRENRLFMRKLDFLLFIKQQLRGESSSTFLISALREWGWIEYFVEKPVLADYVFLDPQRLAKCLACVVEHIPARPSATVTVRELKEVWLAYIPGVNDVDTVNVLLRVMTAFRLAHRQTVSFFDETNIRSMPTASQSLPVASALLDEDAVYVVPAILPKVEPSGEIQDVLRSTGRPKLRIYTFDVFPSVLLATLFVSLHGVSDSRVTGWQQGLFFEAVTEGGFTVVLRAELVRNTIQAFGTNEFVFDLFELCLVQVTAGLIGTDEIQTTNTVVVYRDGVGLMLDAVSGDVISAVPPVVEFNADTDVVVSRDLATGSHGAVALVRTTQANREFRGGRGSYAMKYAKLDDNKRAMESYEAELLVMRETTSCRHTVDVIAFQRDAATGVVTHLLMELFDQSLSVFIAARLKMDEFDSLGWFPVKTTTSWLLQVCHGMQYLKNKGFAHLDLKASNVMVHKQGTLNINTLAIGDFGTTMRVTDGTAVTHPVGTPGHIAPEILGCSEQAPVVGEALFAADVFSFGILVSELVSGIAFGRIRGDDLLAPSDGTSVRPPVGDSNEWDNLRGLISLCLETVGEARPAFEQLADRGVRVSEDREVAVSAQACERREASAKPRSDTTRASPEAEAALLARAVKAEREVDRLEKDKAALEARVKELERQLGEAQRAVEMSADQSEKLEKRLASVGDTAVQWLCENQLEAVAARFAQRLRTIDRATLIRRTMPELLRVFHGDQTAAQTVFDAIQRLS